MIMITKLDNSKIKLKNWRAIYGNEMKYDYDYTQKEKANYFYGYLSLNQKIFTSWVKNVPSIIMVHCIIFIIIINLSQKLDSYNLNGCLCEILCAGDWLAAMTPQFFLLYHMHVFMMPSV